MLEMARADPEQPYPGGHSVWRGYVRRVRQEMAHDQAVADVPIRFEGMPAEYLQVDWGEIRGFPFTHQRPATRYFLACRLKYSRWVWVRFTDNMRQETLFRGLVDCFLALDWVPWVLVFDNMKTVTSGRDSAGQPLWTPARNRRLRIDDERMVQTSETLVAVAIIRCSCDGSRGAQNESPNTLSAPAPAAHGVTRRADVRWQGDGRGRLASPTVPSRCAGRADGGRQGGRRRQMNLPGRVIGRRQLLRPRPGGPAAQRAIPIPHGEDREAEAHTRPLPLFPALLVQPRAQGVEGRDVGVGRGRDREARGAGDGLAAHHRSKYPFAAPAPPVHPARDSLDPAVFPWIRGRLVHARLLAISRSHAASVYRGYRRSCASTMGAEDDRCSL